MRLFVDYNYPDCDPGNSSSAESSDGNSSAYMTSHANNATMSNGRVNRGTSEPPVDYHARTGLRKSGCPFKVSGIVMGSQENLAASDDEQANDRYAIFGKRIRRSITPVRTAPYQPIKSASNLPRSSTNENQPSTNTSNNDELIFSTPFGTTQSNNSIIKHSSKTGRNSGVGNWVNSRNNQFSSISNEINNNQARTSTSSGQMVFNNQIENANVNTNISSKSLTTSENQMSSSINVEKTIYLDQNTH